MMELKPCPFCGCGEAGTQWHHGYWSVTCGYAHDATPSNHCFQDWGEFKTEEQAIESWNSRAENKGKWIGEIIKKKKDCYNRKLDRYQPISCSKCHMPHFEKSNYCPNCGAKMTENE